MLVFGIQNQKFYYDIIMERMYAV